MRKCSEGHKVKVEACDLSKAYRNDKYKEMFHVRCDVKGTCEFGEYYYQKQDAINGWNKKELL